MSSFETGQLYAAKQNGEAWKHVSTLQEGAVILIRCRGTVQEAKYLGVAPRNRKYKLLFEMEGEKFRTELDALVLESDFDRVRDEYLDNLQKRASKQPFSGLPAWHRCILKGSEEVLPDAMCDATGVPHCSTIGYSVQHGKHMPCISN